MGGRLDLQAQACSPLMQAGNNSRRPHSRTSCIFKRLKTVALFLNILLACDADDKADDSRGVPAGQDYIARLGTVHFQPGTEVRRFLDVPEGATWAEMTLRAGNHDTPRYGIKRTRIQGSSSKQVLVSLHDAMLHNIPVFLFVHLSWVAKREYLDDKPEAPLL